jgi:hypothetical protein
MEGIEYTPNNTSRRNYSNTGKYETPGLQQSAFPSSNPTQFSNNQSHFNYGSAAFNTFKTPGVTYTPLSPPSSDYNGSPAPFLPSPKAPCYPLSPPESVRGWSPPASVSSPTSYELSLSSPGTETDDGSLTWVGTPERFQIMVRDLTGHTVTLNDIESTMKVDELKDKFEKKEGIPKHEQKYLFQGKELTDRKFYSH